MSRLRANSLISILRSICPRRRDFWIYALTFLPCAIVLLTIGLQSEFPVSYFTKDPLAVFQLSTINGDCCEVYYGLISNIGVLLWCVTASICLFSAILIYSIEGRLKTAYPLIAAGLFTTWLMLDDLLLLHEGVFRPNGVPEIVTYMIYAVLAVTYLFTSWRTIIQHRASLLVVSLCLLAISIVFDSILHTETNFHVLAEDGSKLMGIAAWAAFHIDLSSATIIDLRVRASLSHLDGYETSKPSDEL